MCQNGKGSRNRGGTRGEKVGIIEIEQKKVARGEE